MAEEQTVKRLDRVHFGAPESCPACGGELAPCFGQIVRDDGVRIPVFDPSVARCRDCDNRFRTEE